MLRTRSPTHCWHTLSLSYGVNLPSSLAQFHSSALGFSPCPPVLVCGTVQNLQRLAAFLVSIGPPTSELTLTYSHLELNNGAIKLHHPTCLNLNPIIWLGYLSSPPHHSNFKFRNINLISIDYAFRPRLRNRLTLGGLPFPRNPWAFGEKVFDFFYRY